MEPLLFVVYNNNLFDICQPSIIRGDLHLFADDAKVYSSYAQELQNSLNNIIGWLATHQLALDPTLKCEHISIKRKNHAIQHEYYIDRTAVCRVPIVRDLGIIISDDLKWSSHISHFVAKASCCSYQVLRSLTTKNVWILLKAYITHVRPKIEYNTVVWSPYLKKDINSLESVQKRFARNICVRCNILFVSYQDRLYKQNAKSLEYRRLVFDLIYVHKIFHNLVEVCLDDSFQLSSNQYNLRRHSWSIKPHNKPSTDGYHNFFSNRICPVWNKLPEQIVSAPNQTAFKSLLNKLDLHTLTLLNIC